VIGQATQRLSIEGIPEAWFRSEPAGSSPDPPDNAGLEKLRYHPAVLVELNLNFRSLRAGLNHSEEQSHTAWIPQRDLAVDWDSPAVAITQPGQVSHLPTPGIEYATGEYQITRADFDQYQNELIDKLVRNSRLRIFFNPVFGLFSPPATPLEDFLPQVAEAALSRVEPELKRLRSRFELQLEQIREAQALKGAPTEDINTESFISRRLHFFASESRLADMFSTLAGSVFGSKEPRQEDSDFLPDEAELREDLHRIEQDAGEALRHLYDEYLSLASEYDVFEIGLQPVNIQVARRMLLWVAVRTE
jgi:hypothetical protein